MAERIPIAELTRLAFVYAIQDREAMVQALHRDDEYMPETKALLAELQRVYRRRYGKTHMEAVLESAVDVGLDELRSRAALADDGAEEGS